MRRGRALAAAGAVLVVLGGSGAVLVAHASDGDRGKEKEAAPEVVAPTATVTRGDLRLTQRVDGELDFGVPRLVTGRGEGVITWLPSAGVEVGRGEQLYRVDDAPVAVLFGDLPLYRTLATPADLVELDPSLGEADAGADPGSQDVEGEDVEGGEESAPPPPPLPDPLEGRDVDLLAANLAELGYWSGATSDVAYDAALAGAVEEWQDDRDVEETGVVEPADVVVARGPVRVDTVVAQVGADAAVDVLTTTGTAKVVVLAVEAEVARSIEPGRRLQVTTADGVRVATTVASIGTTALEDENGGPPTLAVTVEPVKPKQVARAPLGPVTADVVTAARRDVLQVPLTALVSLAGGGYAVETPDSSLVPVTIGMVADGQVEVSGVEEGLVVVVAG